MEYRSKAACTRVALAIAAVLLVSRMQGEELRFEVRHERGLRDHHGALVVDERGVLWQQTDGNPKKRESRRWAYEDIQQLWVSPEKLVVLTYADRKWLAGMDREYVFHRAGGQQGFEPVYGLLRGKLDQRFVAALPDRQDAALWEIPAKRLGVLQGSEGVLAVSGDKVIFRTERPNDSRTWRDADIESVSSAGPFELTITTFERAQAQYGSRKAFHFQLKRRLEEKQFDLLWKRVNRQQGLSFLRAIEEEK